MVKKVRVTRTATTVTELEIPREADVKKMYGFDTIEQLVEHERNLNGEEFWESMVSEASISGTQNEKCEVEIVDG